MIQIFSNVMNYNTDDISNAKQYMLDYKALVDIHNLNAGLIGRFFEKIFGTSAYTDIEEYLQNKYSLSYYKALEILYYTNNDKDVYNPFSK